MATNAFNFTKKSLLEATSIANKPTTYHDTTKRGLKLMVHPSGVKTFILYRKIKGKPERVTIGHFPDITIEQARKQIDVLNSKIVQGINPNEEKRAIRSEMTLQYLFDQYLEKYAKVHKKSWKGDQDQFNRYLTEWSKRKLSAITKANIQKLHTEIGANNGIYAANRLLALLHVLFSRAYDWGWEHPNPAHGIKKFREKSRDRFMQADELPRFFKALSEESNHMIRDYILISLLTGARRSNVLSMKWEQVNFECATWTIPETKNGESHTVPLVPEALDILQARFKNSANKKDDAWVFPSNSATGHLTDPKKTWQRVLKNAGIKDLR